MSTAAGSQGMNTTSNKPAPRLQVVVEGGVVWRGDQHAVAVVAQAVKSVVQDGAAACAT